MAGRILIVDAVATNRIVLKSRLVAACYTPDLAADGRSCLRLAQNRPDLILLNPALPDIAGVDVLRRLRAHPATQDIPIVALLADTARADPCPLFDAGADDVLIRGPDDTVLLARVRNLLRAAEERSALQGSGQGMDILGLAEPPQSFDHPGLVAFLTDRPDRSLRLRKDLAAHCRDRLVPMNRGDLLSAQTSAPEGLPLPDVIVIDADLGGAGGGLHLVSDLRSRSVTRHAAIALLGAERAPMQAMAYDLGVNDIWPDGGTARELAIRLRRLIQRKQLADRLRHSVQDGLRLAVMDPLTGLYNRRYAMPQLAGLARSAQEKGQSFAVMIVDIDRFKAVNDQWGHPQGDVVLIEVARRLAAHLQPGDLVARIGGEEFLVALPDADLAAARAVAARLCDAIDHKPIVLPGGASLRVTVSIGLAIGPTGRSIRQETPALVLDQADKALLAAKSAGRNQVTVARTAA